MTSAPPGAARLASLDSLRGLIIVLMALDHASLFVARHHWVEFWGVPLPDYGGALSLWTRVVSHLCAPGFFLLMGAGMTFFAAARRDLGWSEGRIVRHFLLRGAVLVVVDLVLVVPAFALSELDRVREDLPVVLPAIPGSGGTPYFSPGVLAALGAAMMTGGLLVRLAPLGKGLVALGLLLGCQLLLPGAEAAEEPFSVVARLLLVAGHSGHALIIYPLCPWLAVTLLGMAGGAALRAQPERVMRLALPLGAAALALFAGLRLAGGFATHHPMPRHDWMGLLTVTKYPPSIAFLLLSLGTNAMFWVLLQRGERLWGRPLRVYGRAPLFFYVAHLYLYGAMGLLLPGPTSLAGMYPFWLLGVVLLYPACRAYERFKRATGPDSPWRLF